jgi:NTP pyrophosphatase (non-canonical NTP hydrolase)
MTKKLDDIQKDVDKTIEDFNFNWSEYVQFTHLVEEVGELGEAITVKLGDRKSGSGESALADHDDIEEEIGDILFAILSIASMFRINASKAIEKTFKRYKRKLDKLNNSRKRSS